MWLEKPRELLKYRLRCVPTAEAMPGARFVTAVLFTGAHFFTGNLSKSIRKFQTQNFLFGYRESIEQSVYDSGSSIIAAPSLILQW